MTPRAAEICRNRSFEEGHWLGPTGITPNHYRIGYTEGARIEHIPTLKPESSVGNILQVPPHERELFFVDGAHCLKIFKDYAPLQAAVIQDELELVPGRRYRATAHVYIDIVKAYVNDQKIPPARGSYAARVRLQVGPSGAVWPDHSWHSCDWYSEGELWPFYLERHELVWDFTAREGDGAFALELEAKWGNRNGFFIDALSLVCLDDEPQPQPPAVTGPVLQAPYGSKAGYHAILDDGVVQELRNLRAVGAPAPFVKIQTDVRWAAAAREASPDSVILMRFHSPLEDCQNVATSDLDQMADGLLSVILEKLEQYPHLRNIVNYWKICNEPDPDTIEGYAALGRLMIRCMEKAEAHGLKLAILSLNNGTPEWAELVPLVETGVFRRAKEGGHILALHEGIVWDDKPIDYGYGEPIPGAPSVDGAGAYCFRFEYLYRLLAERNEIIPLVISEFYAAQYNDPAAALERFQWYDEKAARIPYLVAFLPFTRGGTNAGWGHQDYRPVYEQGLIDHIIAIKDRHNARMPAQPAPTVPTVDYEVTVHVPAQTVESYDAVHEIARQQFATVAPYDDAGRLANVKCPSGKGGQVIIYDVDDEEPFVAYFAERYPLAELRFARSAEPTIWDWDISWELAKNGEWPAQTEPWKGLVFHHTLNSSPHATARYCAFQKEGTTVPGIQYSLWITQTGEILLTEKLDRMVRHLGVMPEHRLPVGLEGNLDKHRPPEPMLDAMVRVCKWAIENPAMDVELETITGHDDHSQTACPGWRSGWKADFYRRLRQALGLPELETPLLIGIHDEAGGQWMAREGIQGPCLVHAQVQRTPLSLDFRHLQDKGITVICRLGWGYADGTGTLPRPEDLGPFIRAAVLTIRQTRGVDYYQLFNEPNNRQEWPGFGSGEVFALTPAYVTEAYNEIWAQVKDTSPDRRIGPPPIDPYFGPGSNNRDWTRHIWRQITGADVLFLHAKTQTNDPRDVRSHDRFADDPLRWQYLNLRTVETALEDVPDRFADRPIYVTELNPQHLNIPGGSVGWRHDDAAWIAEAVKYFEGLGAVDGVMFYRYEEAGDQKPFGIQHAPVLLNKIKELAT